MVGYRVQIPDRTHPKKPNGRYPSITKRFKLGEKELAQQWLTREVAYLEDCVLKGVPYVSVAERKKKRQALSVTFSEFGTQWVYNYRDAKGDPIRPDSMRAKRVRVRHLVDFFTTVKDDELLADITAQDCRECRDWLEQFGPVVRTNTMTVLNTILKKAARPIEGKRPALRVGTAPPHRHRAGPRPSPTSLPAKGYVVNAAPTDGTAPRPQGRDRNDSNASRSCRQTSPAPSKRHPPR